MVKEALVFSGRFRSAAALSEQLDEPLRAVRRALGELLEAGEVVRFCYGRRVLYASAG
jgi:hypothetical protein